VLRDDQVVRAYLGTEDQATVQRPEADGQHQTAGPDAPRR